MVDVCLSPFTSLLTTFPIDLCACTSDGVGSFSAFRKYICYLIVYLFRFEIKKNTRNERKATNSVFIIIEGFGMHSIVRYFVDIFFFFSSKVFYDCNCQRKNMLIYRMKTVKKKEKKTLHLVWNKIICDRNLWPAEVVKGACNGTFFYRTNNRSFHCQMLFFSTSMYFFYLFLTLHFGIIGLGCKYNPNIHNVNIFRYNSYNCHDSNNHPQQWNVHI